VLYDHHCIDNTYTAQHTQLSLTNNLTPLTNIDSHLATAGGMVVLLVGR